MITRLIYAFIFIFLVGGGPFHINDVRAETASKVVNSFQSTLLSVMKSAKHTSVRQRYDELFPSISQHFHIPLMTQIATGRHWLKAQPNEKISLIAAFKRVNVATLATLFDGYSGEVFEIQGERPGPSKTTIVFTRLVKADKSNVKLTYIAAKFSGDWRLIDVVVDGGISELKVRRSEYNSTLTRTGLSGLINLLNNKADELMTY